MGSLPVLLSCLAIFFQASDATTPLSPPLSKEFYSISCPLFPSIVKSTVERAIGNEARMGASLLRLHFHDCFVSGCDGSILLDETLKMKSEKNAIPNKDSVRGFDVIDDIKSQLETVCPSTVSCADILAVAARDAVVAHGGPNWDLELGRRDSLMANLTGTKDLPSPFFNVSRLTAAFESKGFTVREMVALSGAHTVGQAQCRFFRGRLYNEPMDPELAASLRIRCPLTGQNNSLSSLDAATPTTFDNHYFKNLAGSKGLLHTDQVLRSGSESGRTYAEVVKYANGDGVFRADFSAAMVKMASLNPLTGSQGQVRRRCNVVN